MNYSKESIIGEIVAKNYRTASVFKSHKIDFCCNGDRTLEVVCKERHLGLDALLQELDTAAEGSSNAEIDFQTWDIDLLADYIEKKHHRYVEKRIPELKAHLTKIAEVHGERHPELLEIEALFSASARDLVSHMQKEENILFPYVRSMISDKESETPVIGSVQDPIEMMKHEHDNEGVRFRKIASLTNDYSPPEDACTTYRLAFTMLQEFEADLHKHIHLENNILFPKTVAAEEALT